MSQKLIQSSKGINSKPYIQELWFLHSAVLINISMKLHEDILNGLKVKERTRFCHWNCYLPSSKGHNSKIYIKELWFLRSAHRLMMVNISMTFSWMVFKLQSYRADGIVFYSRHSQSLRGITENIYIQELWIMWSAHRLMLINISLPFYEGILNGFQVTELQSGRHCILFPA